MATLVKGKRCLYVGGLDNQVTEQTLYSAFVPFGPIKAVQIPMDYNSHHSKGFGFVEYEEEGDAAAARDNMDESELFGKTLRVTIAKPDRPKLGSHKPVWAESDSMITNGDEPAASTSEEPSEPQA